MRRDRGRMGDRPPACRAVCGPPQRDEATALGNWAATGTSAKIRVMGSSPTAAVFDLDGTLVLTEERQQSVWRLFLEHNGIPVDDELLRSLVGRRDRDVLPGMMHLFPAKSLPALLAEIIDIDATVPLGDIQEVPGACDFVRGLQSRGSRLALVTSAKRAYALTVLDRVGLADAFEVIVTSEDVTTGKPDPQGYLAGCRALGVDPQTTVGFEDSPAGVQAVKAAGMYCVAISTGFPPHFLTRADVVVSDFTGFKFGGSDFSGANFTGEIFSGSGLIGFDFSGSDFTGFEVAAPPTSPGAAHR